MTKTVRVHGTQRVYQRTPGRVTISMVCDNMINQSWLVQILCITKWASLWRMVGVYDHTDKVL